MKERLNRSLTDNLQSFWMAHREKTSLSRGAKDDPDISAGHAC
jgi:hypothetical protein